MDMANNTQKVIDLQVHSSTEEKKTAYWNGISKILIIFKAMKVLSKIICSMESERS